MRALQPVFAALSFYEHHGPTQLELRGRRGRGVFLALIAAARRLGLAAPLVRGPDGVRFEFADEAVLRSLVQSGVFEPETTDLLRRHCPAGGTVVDVGANIGYFSVLASRWVTPSGRVLAFEPVADTRQRLARNLALNEARNVKVFDVACGPAASESAILVRPDSGWARLDPRGGVKVTVSTLDAVVEAEGVSRVDVLKIDTEGADFGVLQGASRTIARFRPIVHMEVEHLPEFGHTAEEAQGLLESWGYRVSFVQNAGSRDLFAEPGR